MPELPEVETVRTGLEPVLAGALVKRVVLNRDGLRFAFPAGFAASLAGQRIVAVRRRAKYLLFDLDGGAIWLTHLGMTGGFRVAGANPGEPHRHDHVVAFLARPDKAPVSLVYNDPRRFGFMDLVDDPQTHPRLTGLGPEPLGNRFDATTLAGRFAGRTAPVKTALLDQRNVAGLGNIYVCEALHRSQIAPATAAGALVTAKGRPAPALERLVTAIRGVLEQAIVAGGSTLRDFRHADGELGYFQHQFAVYGRENQPCPAPSCPGTITRDVQAGRSTFHCPRCQRLSRRNTG